MSTDRPTIDQIAAQLLAKRTLSQADLDARCAQALDPDYWWALAPELTIGQSPSAPLVDTTPARAPAQAAERVQREGYIPLGPVIASGDLERLRSSIAVAAAAGWPAIFAYVYDAPWTMFQHPAILATVTDVLGPGARQTADVWPHHVPAVRGAHGWAPHMDYAKWEGRLTVWIPLNEATPDNGCIYVVPRDEAPAGLAAQYTGDGNEPRQIRMAELLQAVRALPAPAGAPILWDGQVLHWGGRHSGHGEPRYSISGAYIAAGVSPLEDEAPLREPASPLLTFEQRLAVICRQILHYQSNEPRVARLVPLAMALLERLGTA